MVLHLPCPEKSPSDKKEYRALQLDNGLKVLLISDTTDGDDDSKIAAASLSVAVGSFHEPITCGGLAHFCEHMVFMGSEKYPDENGFDSFISAAAGGCNAYTDAERTVYLFEVAPAKFKEALDMWAQFFIAPLMKEDAVERELTAVHSEFEMAKIDDSIRRFQIVCEAVMKKGHPMAGFLWGNRTSLKDEQEAKGITAYSQLHDWYPVNYSSKFMQLSIQSPHSLDDLESWVPDIFMPIPSRNLEAPAGQPDYAAGSAYSGINMSKLIKYVPIKDKDELLLNFSVKSTFFNYKSKSISTIVYLFGDEGKGSILSLLKKKDLAYDLCASNDGYGEAMNQYHNGLEIEIRLTEKGMASWSEIVEIFFGYVKTVKRRTPEARRLSWEEQKRISELGWMSKSDSHSQANVVRASENMIRYPSHHWLSGGALRFEYDDDECVQILNEIVPDRCIVTLSSKKFEAEADKLEKYFGGQYCITDLDSEMVQSWKDTIPDSSLAPPGPNNFIADNVELKTSEPSRELKFIQKIDSGDHGECWFKADKVFDLPKGVIKLHMSSNITKESAKTAALASYFGFIFPITIAESIYAATMAGLSFDFKAVIDGFTLKVSGHNDKLFYLVKCILSEWEKFNLSDDMFEATKMQFSSDYKNKLLRPDSYGADLREQISYIENFSNIERRNALEKITKEDVLAFSKTVMKNCYLIMHVEGNFTQEEVAKEYSSMMQTYSPNGQRYINRSVTKLSESCVLKRQNLNPQDVNSVFAWHWQVGPLSIPGLAKLDLLVNIMSEPCFDFLRTKKTLGYSVFPSVRNQSGNYGLSITVKSQKNKFSIEEVKSTVDEFLIHFKEHLDLMTDEQFDQQKSGFVTQKTANFTSIASIFNYNNNEIINEEYIFDRRFKAADSIKPLGKEDITNLYKEVVLCNKCCAIIALEGNTPDNTKEIELEDVNLQPGDPFKNFKVITDVSSFIKPQELFSPSKTL